MPRYEYKCPLCSHEYLEQRPVEQAQIVTRCNGCSNADYVEVTPVVEEPLALVQEEIQPE